MVRVGRLRHRVLAILAVTVTFAAAVATAPAAHAKSPYEVSEAELKVVCDAFMGDFTSRTDYGCTLPDSRIDCLAALQSCQFETRAEMPGPFQDLCASVRGAKFSNIDKTTYACESGTWTVLTDCELDAEAPGCKVGVILSEVPVR